MALPSKEPPMTSKQAERLTDALIDAFDQIGNTQATKPRGMKGNSEAIAYEFYVAQRLASLAEKRKKRAQQDAIDAEIIFDHKEHPMAPGDYAVYSGSHVNVSLKVKNPVKVLDQDAFVEQLKRHGVNAELVDRLAKECVKHHAPAHQFTASLR